jgi:hypothetical protein
MKKYIILGFLFVVLAVVAFYLWSQSGIIEPGTLNNVKALTHRKFSDSPAVSMTASANGDSLWFADRDGRIYRINSSGATEFPSAVFSDKPLRRLLWSPSGGDFLAIGTRNTNKSFSYYNSAANAFVALPQNVVSMDWLPDGRRVAMIWKSGDGKSQQLVVSDADGSGYKIVTSLPWPDFEIKVSPTGDQALLLRTSPKPNKIYLFNLEDGNYETLAESKRILNVKWIDPKRFIYDTLNENDQQKIVVYDKETKTGQELSLATSVDKVVWNGANEEFYAAVPANDNGDKIVRIKPGESNSRDYYTGLQNIRVVELFMSNNKLYFVNSEDGRSYVIE